MTQTPQIVKVSPPYSLPSDDELYSETQMLRQELGSLITDLRIMIGNIRKTPEDWYPAAIADALEEIING